MDETVFIFITSSKNSTIYKIVFYVNYLLILHVNYLSIIFCINDVHSKELSVNMKF